MNLRPEFKDSQVCLHCGAPAMLLGEPWEHTEHGEVVRDFYAVPIEKTCHPSTPGCVTRTREVVEGRARVSKPYSVLVYTHLCMREAHADEFGLNSEEEKHRYACPALTASDVTRGDLRKFRRCWDGWDEQ